MQWWNDFLDWFGTRDGKTVLFSAIIPFVAILVAGIVAAMIGRGSTKRLLASNDRENRVAAVATLIGVARRASVWNTLSAPEQQHADHVASEADVRVRLLAVPGSGLAADWAAHEVAAMKRNSVSFSFQAEQSLIEFRERTVQWQAKPSRAKKLFKNDLDLWAYEDSQTTKDIISQQQAWAASQVASEGSPVSTASPIEADEQDKSESTFAPTARSVPSAAPVPDASASGASASASSTASMPSSAPTRPPAAVSIADIELDARTPRESGHGAPQLVEPQVRPRDDQDASEDNSDERLDDSVYSAPANAKVVTKRISPPTVGNDGRTH